MGRLYMIADAIMKLAYLNLLWVFFSMAGLIVAGIMPATAAMFGITRKWIRGHTDIPVTREFWKLYKQNFIKTNLAGWLFAAAGFMFFVNFQYFSALNGLNMMLLMSMTAFAFIIYLLIVFNFFQVFVHYRLKLFGYLKYSLIIGFSFLHYSVLIMICALVIAVLSLSYTTLLLVFSGSIFSYITMWFSNKMFNKIDKNYQKLAINNV